MSVLTANQVGNDVRIVASASKSENVDKLKRAGADTVISPSDIVGQLMVKSATSGMDTEEIAEKVIEEEIEEGEKQ